MAHKRSALKRKQKKQVAALTVIIIAAAIAAIIMLTPAFNIRKITVTGNSVLKTEDVIRSSGLVTGINIFSISTHEASDAIEEVGYVDRAKVRRSLPGTIEIEITEAVAVASINAKTGKILITADGRSVDFVKDNEKEVQPSRKVPVIKGLKDVKYRIGKKITSKDEKKLETLFMCLKVFSKDEMIFNMTSIDISDSSKIGFTYNGGKLSVNCGSTQKLEYKMECFAAILSQIGDNPTGYVDLERMIYRQKQ